MTLLQDVREELKRRMTALGWKGRKADAIYHKTLRGDQFGHLFLQIHDAKSAGRLVSMHPIIGLGDRGFSRFLRDALGGPPGDHPQITRHIWHLFDQKPPGPGWIEVLDADYIDWHLQMSLKTLERMQDRYPDLRAMLAADPHWSADENPGGAHLQARRILGAAYLGDIDQARRALAAARTYWRAKAEERGEPIPRPLETLERCEAAIAARDPAGA